MHSAPWPARSGHTPSQSAPKPPRSPRQKMRSQPRARASAHVRDWGHVRLFTPWDLNVSDRMRRALPGAPTGSKLPTGDELAAELLDPLAELPSVKPRLRLGSRVEAVAREGLLKHEEIAS